MHECIWCGRQFKPRPTTEHNRYSLISAGQAICWSCADLYEAEEIKLHMDPVKGRLEDLVVVTQSGSVLPFTIYNFERPKTRWGRWSGRAVDSYGNWWSLKSSDGQQVTLRPLGA